MGHWDKKFLKTLKSLEIYTDIHKRYVDDIFKTLPPINKGWVYNQDTKRMSYDRGIADTDKMSLVSELPSY